MLSTKVIVKDGVELSCTILHIIYANDCKFLGGAHGVYFGTQLLQCTVVSADSGLVVVYSVSLREIVVKLIIGQTMTPDSIPHVLYTGQWQSTKMLL